MKLETRTIRQVCSLVLLMALTVKVSAGSVSGEPVVSGLVPGIIRVHSASEVMDYFQGLEFEWPGSEHERTLIVPRIVTNDLPEGWERGLDIVSRKSIFIRLVTPLILMANEQINADRTYILDALASGHGAQLRDSARYRMIIASYRLPADADPDEVLKRVDVIPPALAIAQAILESGWGTSRFASEGNALYGEWVWDGGMEPGHPDRSLGNYGVQSFSSLLRSALSYMLNLNTSRHYESFREARMEMRLQARPLNACNLASHLSAYAAVDGKIYRKALCDLIEQNKLHIADTAVLASPPAGMLDFQVGEEPQPGPFQFSGTFSGPVHSD